MIIRALLLLTQKANLLVDHVRHLSPVERLREVRRDVPLQQRRERRDVRANGRERDRCRRHAVRIVAALFEREVALERFVCDLLRLWTLVQTAEDERKQLRASCPRVDCADRKSTRLNSSHTVISYAVFCLKKKKKEKREVFIRKKKRYKKEENE